MLISSKYKFIFIHIPRTGGTSLEYSLSSLDDSTILEIINLIKPINSKIEVIQTFDNIKHYTQETILPILNNLRINYSDWYEFTLVRNPYNRIISVYENYARYDNHSAKHNRYLYSFDEFLTQISYAKRNNDFFKSQCYWIDNPLTSKVDILKYENLQEEYINLGAKLGVELPKLKHLQKTEYKDKIVLTDEQKEKVYKLYQDDFDKLGYDK